MTWLDRRPVVFHCPCSKERAAATLALLDEDELTHMLASNEQGQVTCNFCRRTYTFSSREIDAIRADVRQKAGARS
jgi:molecular chaperone Hsp33